MNAAQKQHQTSPLPSSSSSSPAHASSQSAGGGSKGSNNATIATTSSRTGAFGDRDVGDIVLKAKRAAASLWMVLHAQSCSLSNAAPSGHAPGSLHRQPLCPHRGCDEMKRLLRHIRGCPASFDQLACPREYPGCCSVRKLMAHHKRCRALRLAEARRQSPSCTSSFPSPPPPCLICSLVARHARNILEGGIAPSPPSAQRRDRSARPRSASAAVSGPIPSESYSRENDSASMPPPPPRRPRAASDIPFGIRNRGRNDAPQDNHQTTDACSSSCSPPNESHLMRNRETRKIWTALASATGPAPCVGGGLLEHSPDLLSRSFDSSRSRPTSCRVVVTPPAKRRMGSSPLRGIASGINNAEGKASRSGCIPSLCTEGASSLEDASSSSSPPTLASPSSVEREGSRKRRQDQPSPATLSQQQRPRSKSEGGPSSPPSTPRGTGAAVNVTETMHHQDDGTAIDDPMPSTDGAATSANSATTLLSFHRRSRSFSELEESHILSNHHHQRSSYGAVYRQEEEAAIELNLRIGAAGGRGGGFGADSDVAGRCSGCADDAGGSEGEGTTDSGGASLSMTRRRSSCGSLSALAPPE